MLQLILIFHHFIFLQHCMDCIYWEDYFFWGKVTSRVLKLNNDEILNEEKNISALSLYWTYLLIVWIVFFLMIYLFNDSFIEWCKSLVS